AHHGDARHVEGGREPARAGIADEEDPRSGDERLEALEVPRFGGEGDRGMPARDRDRRDEFLLPRPSRYDRAPTVEAMELVEHGGESLRRPELRRPERRPRAAERVRRSGLEP